MRDRVQFYFQLLIMHIGIDQPSNSDQIIDYITDSIEGYGYDDWTFEDLRIEFRRWIEDQTKCLD